MEIGVLVRCGQTSLARETMRMNRKSPVGRNQRGLGFFGGADGARTRDPRRDRSVIKLNVYAGFDPNRISKSVKNVSISCGFADFYSKVFDSKL